MPQNKKYQWTSFRFHAVGLIRGLIVRAKYHLYDLFTASGKIDKSSSPPIMEGLLLRYIMIEDVAPDILISL